MIRFFRTIRRQLLTESKISKYLLYATGEIVLVVIGILIAVQINTWNKESQNDSLQRRSLENLIEDLVIQKEIIIEQLDNEAQWLAEIDTCLSFISNEPIPIEELDRLLGSLASRHTFIANKATFDNMISAGSMVLISNPDLQNAIVRYYKQLDYTASVVNNNNLFLIDNQFGIFVHNNALGLRLDDSGMIDMDHILSAEQRFTLRNQLMGRWKASHSIQARCRTQLEATEKLIRSIKTELNN